ncbi:hypothetical protein ADL22_21820 [Streptomyces sp. NRRL F-4489]|uniref:hypothetical protein n=1 Tax=Streptomyces sp. NRRL F-4489 TaxID=1609095 RepID=UPI000749367C|nr:hypothetical protein [Streptomyces sp. NRRL F-4489]KUL37312.1 hypothetical protein ADL22_21820 [Streptomyces sp. NRRL F-4489]
MIQPPEWTGYLPGAVSALHALGVLLRLCRGRIPADGPPPRSGTADGPRGRGGACRCVAGPPVGVRVDAAAPAVRVDAGAPAGVPVRVVVTVTAAPGGGMAGEERGPW